MQRDFAYVVVCTILASQISSRAEENYADDKGNADKLFQYLQTHQKDTDLVFYTVKRSYASNLLATQGKTETCIKATIISANESAAQLCTTFKTVGENSEDPFVITYKTTGSDTMEGEPVLDRMVVQYVNEKEKCLIVQHMGKETLDASMKSCDMVRASIDATGVECNKEFSRMCGSSTKIISTTDGCNDVPTPRCSETSQPPSSANEQV
ncbi:uncharacterized protein LOC115321315 [Ixodes scapularis]|uniref:uncharacterized protein LOC115321315 n=1 Tax=Ixodes scapularis TaxID=6945 RepID=UPI001A9E430E|nr:uncharacterized protein LOC115321315 [Ixodes scapularis]